MLQPRSQGGREGALHRNVATAVNNNTSKQPHSATRYPSPSSVLFCCLRSETRSLPCANFFPSSLGESSPGPAGRGLAIPLIIVISTPGRRRGSHWLAVRKLPAFDDYLGRSRGGKQVSKAWADEAGEGNYDIGLRGGGGGGGEEEHGRVCLAAVKQAQRQLRSVCFISLIGYM